MGDPRTQLVSFPLGLGMDNVSNDEAVQPVGPTPRVVLSQNTRLTQVPGCVSKAPKSTNIRTGFTGPSGGIIPHGKLDSTALPLMQEIGTRRSSGLGVGTLNSVTGQVFRQSAYYPAQVAAAGLLPGSATTRFNASCCYDAANGLTYFVTQRYAGSPATTGLFLTVLADDGRELVTTAIMLEIPQGFDDTRNFSAVTAHGSTILLWYAAGGDADIFVRTIAVNFSSFDITLGTATLVYTQPAGAQGASTIQVACDEADTANAYLIAIDDTVATSVTVKRVSTSSLANVATATLACGGTPAFVSIAYLSATAVLVAVSVTGSKVKEFELNPTTLATVWSQSGQLYDGVPGTGFQTISTAVYRMFSVSRIEATFDSTYVEARTAAGAAGASGVIKHQTMIGQVATRRDPSGDLSILITTQVCYRPEQAIDSYDTSSDFFVPDPSVEVFAMCDTYDPALAAEALMPSCVARLGVDLCIRYPGSLSPMATFGGANQLFVASSCSCITAASRLLVTYLAENTTEGAIAIGYAPRYAWIDFASLQPRYGFTSEGATVVAGALPAVWDGAEFTEYSPLRVPLITGTGTGGLGPALSGAPATYQFAAVVSWKDSQGQLHRSPPSDIISFTGTGLKPTLQVRLPTTYRNVASQFGLQVTVYASEPDGVVLYAQDYWLLYLFTLGPQSLIADITTVTQPIVDAFHPAIYTDGSATQPLAAFCPNACIDAAVIADRLWLIDAERSSRAWFSKPKETEIFLEMSPDLFVDLPANAGSLFALTEMNGNPLFLTTRGLWTLSGEGPDALNNPPFFSATQQVSDVACTQKNSVLRTPAGIMFVSNNRFVLFNGQVREFKDINATLYGNIVGTSLFRKQQEACFFTSLGYVYVYNWQADAWTLWDRFVSGVNACTGVGQRSTDNCVLYYGDNGELWLMDPEDVHVTAQMRVETGWMLMGGPQDDNALHDVMLHSKNSGAHRLSVEIGTDYGALQPAKIVSASDIVSATINGRYDVDMQPRDMPARTARFVFQEQDSAGEAWQPVNVTMLVVKLTGKMSQAIRRTGRK